MTSLCRLVHSPQIVKIRSSQRSYSVVLLLASIKYLGVRIPFAQRRKMVQSQDLGGTSNGGALHPDIA